MDTNISEERGKEEEVADWLSVLGTHETIQINESDGRVKSL